MTQTDTTSESTAKTDATKHRDKSISFAGGVLVGVMMSVVGAFFALLGSTKGKHLFKAGLLVAFGAGALSERHRANAAELEVEYYYNKYRDAVTNR